MFESSRDGDEYMHYIHMDYFFFCFELNQASVADDNYIYVAFCCWFSFVSTVLSKACHCGISHLHNRHYWQVTVHALFNNNNNPLSHVEKQRHQEDFIY